MQRPELKWGRTWVRVDGVLIDLVALDHWRQGQPRDHKHGHDAHQIYYTVKRWHKKYRDGSDLEPQMWLTLHGILTDLIMFVPFSEVKRHHAFKVYNYYRYLKGWGDWPPKAAHVDKYQRLKRDA